LYSHADQSIGRTRMFELVTSFWVTRAVYVAAELEIADYLAAGPRSVAELAEATGTHEQSLYRLLRLLASVGVFTETDPRTFQSTSLGSALRSDIPGSLRPYVLLQLGIHYDVWGELSHAIRTGDAVFEKALGAPLWQYYAEHPAENAILGAAMSSMSEIMTADVLAAYDFGPYHTIVDVGGGEGALLTAIMAGHPSAHGILFDQPHVVANAHQRIAAAGLTDRCEVVGGDFFAEVPGGGDLYVAKWVLHDWSDEESVEILSVIRKAMPDQATLLIVDSVIQAGNQPAPSKLVDLNMLVCNAGQERTREQFESVLTAAGFGLVQIRSLPSASSLVEAKPVS